LDQHKLNAKKAQEEAQRHVITVILTKPKRPVYHEVTWILSYLPIKWVRRKGKRHTETQSSLINTSKAWVFHIGKTLLLYPLSPSPPLSIPLLLFSSIPKCKVSHDFERLNSHCWKLDRATSCNVTLYYYLFNAILVFIVLFYALLFLKNWERTSKWNHC